MILAVICANVFVQTNNFFLFEDSFKKRSQPPEKAKVHSVYHQRRNKNFCQTGNFLNTNRGGACLALHGGINLISLEQSERMIDFSAVTADRLIKTRITRACLCGVSSGEDRCQGQTQWAWFMKYDNTETFMIIDWYC